MSVGRVVFTCLVEVLFMIQQQKKHTIMLKNLKCSKGKRKVIDVSNA